MNTYKIQITETLSRVIEIQASDLDEALHTVEDDYKREAIVLDADDCVEYEIEPWQVNYQIAAEPLRKQGFFAYMEIYLLTTALRAHVKPSCVENVKGKFFQNNS